MFKGLALPLKSGVPSRHSDAVFGGTSGTTISSIGHVQIPGRRPTNLNLRCQEHKPLVQLKSVFDPSAMPSDIRSFFGGGGPRPAEATAKTTTVNLTFSSLTASQPLLFANCCGHAGSYALPYPSILGRYKPAKIAPSLQQYFQAFPCLNHFQTLISHFLTQRLLLECIEASQETTWTESTV